MNSDQVTGIIRAIVTAGTGYAAGKGLIIAPEVTAAIITILVSIWSFITNKKSA